MPNINDGNQNGNGQGEPEPIANTPAEDELFRLIGNATDACRALYNYIGTDDDKGTGSFKRFDDDWVTAAYLLALGTLCAFEELEALNNAIDDGQGSFRELIDSRVPGKYEFDALRRQLGRRLENIVGRYSGST